jgi:hypothetical protein
MPYELELELEQRQRYENSLIAEAERDAEKWMAEQGKQFVTFGSGRLCNCGLKQSQDCDCPF